jgi:hypothetical protein
MTKYFASSRTFCQDRENGKTDSADGPEHAGAFQPLAEDGSAAGSDDAATDEQALSPELRVAHAVGVSFEVIGLVFRVSGELWLFDRGCRRIVTGASILGRAVPGRFVPVPPVPRRGRILSPTESLSSRLLRLGLMQSVAAVP